jgi:lysophospholipase L1-like esterase
MEQNQFSRRHFFRTSLVSAAGLTAIPAIVEASIPGAKRKSGKITPGQGSVILFQGDSITDAGREKQKEVTNNAASLGTGYAFMSASRILEHFPEKNLQVYNRGISGNKVFQLADRWEKDCIQLKPELLSILIGVNDYWHMRDGKYNGTSEIYENDFRELLNRTKESFPNVKLVICQPFGLTGTRVVNDEWMKPFLPYQEVANKIAQEFGAIWVPFQKVFDEAVKHAPATYWSGDGVHPSIAGAQLMANAWLAEVFGI